MAKVSLNEDGSAEAMEAPDECEAAHQAKQRTYTNWYELSGGFVAIDCRQENADKLVYPSSAGYR